MTNVNLMSRYPKPSRSNLLKERSEVNSKERELAYEFDYEYFDGPRRLGLGGYKYIPGYWEKVVEDFIDFYKLDQHSSILDVGCGKGFMLFDFSQKIPILCRTQLLQKPFPIHLYEGLSWQQDSTALIYFFLHQFYSHLPL